MYMYLLGSLHSFPHSDPITRLESCLHGRIGHTRYFNSRISYPICTAFSSPKNLDVQIMNIIMIDLKKITHVTTTTTTITTTPCNNNNNAYVTITITTPCTCNNNNNAYVTIAITTTTTPCNNNNSAHVTITTTTTTTKIFVHTICTEPTTNEQIQNNFHYHN